MPPPGWACRRSRLPIATESCEGRDKAMTVHMLAVFAQHEREMISQRTKAAYAQMRLRGVVLGNPNLHLYRLLAAAANRTPAPPAVLALMREARSAGCTLRHVAAKLNGLGLRTTRGSEWYASTVRAELGRAAEVPTAGNLAAECQPPLLNPINACS
jgi:DNA invertase Pin-like site-specific DNA recombinase